MLLEHKLSRPDYAILSYEESSLTYYYRYTCCTITTAIEFGFQRTNYSVSEEPQSRDVGICVVVNNGTLERGIEIIFNVTDITAESMTL